MPILRVARCFFLFVYTKNKLKVTDKNFHFMLSMNGILLLGLQKYQTNQNHLETVIIRGSKSYILMKLFKTNLKLLSKKCLPSLL